jgi:DNA-binding phage protein
VTWQKNCSFSENGNPTLKTTIAVMKALGIELTAMANTDRGRLL